MKFLIVGAGAIGGTVAAHLSRSGHDVTVTDTSQPHLEAIADSGIRIIGPVEEFTARVKTVGPQELASNSLSDLDVVAIAVKGQATRSAMELVSDHLSAHTTLLTLQNGLTPEIVAEMIDPNRIVAALVNFGADLLEPGVIEQGNAATVRIGEWNSSEVTPRVSELARVIPYAEATPNIRGFIWSKLAYGAILAAGATSDLTIEETLTDPEFHDLMKAIAREVLVQAPVPCEPFDGFTPSDLDASLKGLAELNRASAKKYSGIYRDLMILKRPAEAPFILGALKGRLIKETIAMIGAIERGERTCQRENLSLLATYERTLRLTEGLGAVVDLISAPLRSATGPLAGVPVGVKDIVAIQGQVRGNGNPHDLGDGSQLADAPVITALRAAGADIYVRTTLLEYAAGAVHPDSPEAMNPINPATTAGGSSGGSASLVASGACTIAVGTDTGGSIRIPAHYCGIVGLKPSFGLIPCEGVTPLSPTFDHVGFLTTDVAWMKRAMAPFGRPHIEERSLDELRIGYFPEHLSHPALHSDVRTATETLLARLDAAGAALIERPLEIYHQLDQLFGPILLFEAWQVHREQVEKNPDHFGPDTLRLLLSAKEISATEYEKAVAERERLLPLARFHDLDLLLTPAVPYTAPETTPPIDTPMGEVEGIYTGPFNNTGEPAIVLPLARDAKGLPIGVQLVGRFGQDFQLLHDAAGIEALIGYSRSI